MSPPVHPPVVGRSVCLYVIIFKKGREVSPPCSYRSTCFLISRLRGKGKEEEGDEGFEGLEGRGDLS